MNCVRLRILTIALLCYGAGCHPLIYKTPVVIGGSVWDDNRPFAASGELPLLEVLSVLRDQQAVVGWPRTADLATTLWIRPNSKVVEVVRLVELKMSWTVAEVQGQGRAFFPRHATHRMEAPDLAGRVGKDSPLVGEEVRPVSVIRILFCRGDVALNRDGIGGGGQYIALSGSVTNGVETTFGNQTTRSTPTGVIAASGNGNFVQTGRETVSAGVSWLGVFGTLPGGNCRMDGMVTVSSFVGETVETVSVQVPVSIDGPRSKWLCVFVSDSASALMKMSFRGNGLDLGVGMGSVMCFVRVD